MFKENQDNQAGIEENVLNDKDVGTNEILNYFQEINSEKVFIDSILANFTL